MRKSYLRIICLGVAMPSLVLAQTVVSTPIVGFYKKTFPAGGSLQTVALLKAVSYQGSASSVSGAVLSVSSPGWASNQFAPANGLPAYYVEITSGSRAGYIYDILSNGSASVTVVDSDVANAGSSPSFLIRAHTKISDVYATATNLTDYNDQITVYNSDGTNTTLLRDSSTTTGWLDATTFVESDAVVYPSQGVVLSTGASGQLTVTGSVKTTPTVVPLYANQVNIVSLANPSDVTKDVQTINLGTNLIEFNDQVGTYSSDGSLGQTNTLLWAGGAEGFYDATTFSIASGVNITGTEPVIVTAGSNSIWTVTSPLQQ